MNRQVSVSQGRPASQESLPTDASFFAALLMLREFMHHLHFEQVTRQTIKESLSWNSVFTPLATCPLGRAARKQHNNTSRKLWPPPNWPMRLA
jgi:hypothetical protein